MPCRRLCINVVWNNPKHETTPRGGDLRQQLFFFPFHKFAIWEKIGKTGLSLLSPSSGGWVAVLKAERPVSEVTHPHFGGRLGLTVKSNWCWGPGAVVPLQGNFSLWSELLHRWWPSAKGRGSSLQRTRPKLCDLASGVTYPFSNSVLSSVS